VLSGLPTATGEAMMLPETTKIVVTPNADLSANQEMITNLRTPSLDSSAPVLAHRDGSFEGDNLDLSSGGLNADENLL